MRFAILSILLVTGCSSATASPDAPAATDASSDDVAAETASPGDDSAAAISDAGAEADALCILQVDDADISHGCTGGGMGPGDKDDGGGAPTPPPPDAALDASDLPLGASCWDNAQCASGICFDYKIRGTFCTQRCWTNANCPPPANGCNGMGVCRFGDGGN